MDDRLIVTASPHIRDNATTRGLMGNVLIALVPSIVASGLIFGMRAILLTAVTTLACVVFEYLYCKLMHKPNPVGDLSACVTGVILALNMPVSMPLWIAIVGALVAIVIIKQSGGLLFGAVFMATDYVTSPFTTKGKLFYGVFIGLITFLIRNFASMNEGMSFAILLGNLMTPWFNAWGHQTPLGYKKPQKAAKGGKE